MAGYFLNTVSIFSESNAAVICLEFGKCKERSRILIGYSTANSIPPLFVPRTLMKMCADCCFPVLNNFCSNGYYIDSILVPFPCTSIRNLVALIVHERSTLLLCSYYLVQ